MEFFHKANSPKLAVRLISHHNKYLLAEDTGDATVKQHGTGTAASARWSVEFVDETHIRLKSVKTNMYLSASDDPFKIGFTGKTVSQAFHRTDSGDWVPLKEGNARLMLRNRAGTFLCANGSSPPWRNAVTHDLLCATANVDWAIWVVEVVDREDDPAGKGAPMRAVMKKMYSVPANSEGGRGNGASPPAGVVRSVRTMSPCRQKTTMSSNSCNNKEAKIDVDQPLALEVRMAKQTFMEVQDVDFKTLFSSGRFKSIESFISVLLSYTNPKNPKGMTSNSKLVTLRDQLQTLKLDKTRSTNELDEYEAFKEKKMKMKAELQREVSKARDLQSMERQLDLELEKTRGKRAELIYELQKVEREIKTVEEERVEIEFEMEKLCRVIRWRSEGVKDMEGQENVWVKRKVLAERTIKEVEHHWAINKASF